MPYHRLLNDRLLHVQILQLLSQNLVDEVLIVNPLQQLLAPSHLAHSQPVLRRLHSEVETDEEELGYERDQWEAEEQPPKPLILPTVVPDRRSDDELQQHGENSAGGQEELGERSESS